mmetsp:Transcript_43855/g.95522  ORF Transcript_43855/g.95522 Transcript_43855/m.95522 type:complete len:124 (+) Transcript_43855:170-541(+)
MESRARALCVRKAGHNRKLFRATVTTGSRHGAGNKSQQQTHSPAVSKLHVSAFQSVDHAAPLANFVGSTVTIWKRTEFESTLSPSFKLRKAVSSAMGLGGAPTFLKMASAAIGVNGAKKCAKM